MQVTILMGKPSASVEVRHCLREETLQKPGASYLARCISKFKEKLLLSPPKDDNSKGIIRCKAICSFIEKKITSYCQRDFLIIVF